jgi:hypothetical protein
MPLSPDIPRETGSIQVLIRFLVRMTLLGVFAAVGSEGVGKTFEALLLLSVFYCVFAASLRREMPFRPVLTHFDEATGYAALGVLASALS